MKTTAKVWLATTILLILVSINAQTQSRERLLSFGVNTSVNITNVSGGDFKSKTPMMGYGIGVVMDYGLKSAYMKLGVSFVQREFKVMDEGTAEQTASMTYLHVPLHAAYRINVSENKKLVFHGGPFIAYGLLGKWSADDEGKSRSVFTGESFIKFDYGLEAAVALEFRKMILEAGATFGIPNINNATYDKVKTQNYYLSVGYKF